MARISKAYAIGAFIIACNKLTDKRGGKQKLQRIVGESIFYPSSNGKKWFFKTQAIKRMSIKKLSELTEKIAEE